MKRWLTLALAALALLGAVCYLRYPAHAFYRASERSFQIPGLSSGFIPQGLSYDAGADCFFVCGYQMDGGEARVYIVDKKSRQTRAWARLEDPEGGALIAHCGGLSAWGGKVYLAGDGGVYLLEEAELLNAGAGGGVKYKAFLPTMLSAGDPLRIAFTDVQDGLLTVGEFHREPQYPTLPSHKYTLSDGTTLEALCVTYALGDDGQTLTPVAAWCLPDLTQGMSIDGGTLYLSTSWGLGTSHLLRFDLSALSPFDALRIDGTDVPLTALDPKLAAQDMRLPPMAEEIEVADGRLYVMNESASAKYRFGIFTGGRWCHSIPIEQEEIS